jgi:hypothetical protein
MAASTIEVTPNYAIGYYLMVLLGYLVYKTMNIPASDGSNQEIVPPLIAAAFVMAIVGGEYMISVGMTKTACGFEQWDVAAMYTFLPWVLIVGAVRIILMIRPGWLVPFSNTFGYFLASAIFGITEVFRKLLKPGVNLSSADKEDPIKASHAREVERALQEIYEDESRLINQFTPDNITANIKKFSSADLMYTISEFKKNPEYESMPDPVIETLYASHIETIKKAVWFKLFVSEFLWLLLSGILAISVTYNYIMNYGCKLTPEQIALKDAKLSAISSAKANQTPVSNTTVITE